MQFVFKHAISAIHPVLQFARLVPIRRKNDLPGSQDLEPFFETDSRSPTHRRRVPNTTLLHWVRLHEKTPGSVLGVFVLV